MISGNTITLKCVGGALTLIASVMTPIATAFEIPHVSGDVVQEYDWAKADWSRVPGGKPANVIVIPANHGGPARLQVRTAPTATTQPEKTEVRTTLLVVEAPTLKDADYALQGTVAYHDVRDSGYLEMVSVFPDGSEYFSRGLDHDGPMGVLTGSSSVRGFVLPFHSRPGHVPSRLVLNLVMVGEATVELGPVKLLDSAEYVSVDQVGGMIGGVLGVAVGCLGGLIGTLCGLGRAKPLVTGLMWFMIGSGAVLSGLGTAALVLRQPYALYYPLLLCGVLECVLGIALFPAIRRRYRELELRRMQAVDVGVK